MTYYHKNIRPVKILNNIEKIESFLEDTIHTTMTLPKVNDEVVIFYQILIQEITKNKKLHCYKIDNYKNINELIAPSLFEEKNIYIIDSGNTKDFMETVGKREDKSQKFFIFLNYATYKKKTGRSLQLNAYDYKKDILSFTTLNKDFQSLENKLKIEFLNFSYNNPHLFFSELKKSEIQLLIPFKSMDDEDETILSIRKTIFNYKNDFSIKVLSKLYGLFKKEVKAKKFNF